MRGEGNLVEYGGEIREKLNDIKSQRRWEIVQEKESGKSSEAEI